MWSGGGPPSERSAAAASEQIPSNLSSSSSSSSNLSVCFFAVSYVSVCSHAPTPPRSFITHSLALSLSEEATNQMQAEDTGDEEREGCGPASLLSLHVSAQECRPAQLHSDLFMSLLCENCSPLFLH